MANPDRVLPAAQVAGPLLPWLLATLAPMNRTRVKQLLTHGSVHVNGVSVTRHDHPLAVGDRVSLGKPRHTSLTVIHEDHSLIVIDKPAGLLTVATDAEKEDTAFVRLTTMLPTRPAVVHRLDRDTSGLLLFAKSHAIRDTLQAAWDSVEKTYLAVVSGVPRPASGIIDNYLIETKSLKVRSARSAETLAKRAISRYRVLKSRGANSLIEVIIETGRKHQIRVHLAGLGTPIVGDTLYGSTVNPAGRLGLHANRLAFPHPVTAAVTVIESPLPAPLMRIV
ncbi:RluA family pseudouridine synthase [soil metagenome]